MKRQFIYSKSKIFNTFILLYFLLTGFPAQAQYFEWAHTFFGRDNSNAGSSEYGSNVRNSFIDSEGNCYIFGSMASEATYEGEQLAPVSHSSVEGTLIAKIAPNGEMVWHKAITCPGQSYRLNFPVDMRPMGDSAFVCVVYLDLNGPIYYLDTLLEDVSDCLIPTDSLLSTCLTAFITFDLDGNVLEQHFLQTGYLDAQGQIMTVGMLHNNQFDNIIFNMVFPLKKLQIDNSGNIISLTNFATCIYYETDTETVEATFENGLLSGFCILVDGHSRFKMHVNPHEKHALWTPVVMKFDPHFDSLLAWRHLFENERGDPQVWLYSFNIDKENSLYICAYFQAFSDDVVSFTVAGNPSIGDSVGYDAIDQEIVLLKYDSNLNCQFLKKMEWGERNRRTQKCLFSNVCFAEDSSFFATATILKDEHVDAYIDNLHFTDGGCSAAIIHFDKDGTALSYGKAHSHHDTFFQSSSYLDQSIVAKNNRVIAQVEYVGDIFANHDSASVDASRYNGDGLYQWDYDGNPISYIDFHTVNRGITCPGGVYLHDSILYVTCKLGGGTFGDIVIPDNGRSRGFVAKYVDTNFMHPYVAPVGIADSPSQRQPLLYPNPARNEVFIDLGPDPIRQVSAINTLGQRQSLPFVANRIDLSSCRPGIYILEIKTPSATHKSKLVKMK